MFKLLFFLFPIFPLLLSAKTPVNLLLNRSYEIQRPNNAQDRPENVFSNCNETYYASVETNNFSIRLRPIFEPKMSLTTLQGGFILPPRTIHTDSEGNLYLNDEQNVYRILRTPTGHSDPEIIYQVPTYNYRIQRMFIDCTQKDRWFVLSGQDYYSREIRLVENERQQTTESYYGKYLIATPQYVKEDDRKDIISLHAGYDLQMRLESEDGRKVGFFDGVEFRDFPYSFYAQNSVGSLDEDVSERASMIQIHGLIAQKYYFTFISESDVEESIFINYSKGDFIRKQKSIPVNLKAGIPQTYEVVVNITEEEIPEFKLISDSLPKRTFIRGDYNFDGEVNIADSLAVLNNILQELRSSCDDTLDVNDDGKVDFADYIQLNNYILTKLQIFEPAPPFPEAGIDPTEDEISCN